MNIPTTDEMASALALTNLLETLEEASASAGGSHKNSLKSMTLDQFLQSIANNGIRFEFTNANIDYYRNQAEMAIQALKSLQS